MRKISDLGDVVRRLIEESSRERFGRRALTSYTPNYIRTLEDALSSTDSMSIDPLLRSVTETMSIGNTAVVTSIGTGLFQITDNAEGGVTYPAKIDFSDIG